MNRPVSHSPANPAGLLTAALQRAIGSAIGQEHGSEDPLLRPAANPHFGDFQANVAMGLGKRLGRPPRQVAEAIVAHFDAHALADVPQVAGPGFINLRLTPQALAAAAGALADDPRLGTAAETDPPVTVVDYSSPNVAKEMHVGHLRSTVIGDAIARTLDFLYGPDHVDRVIRQNHLGDWGTQFGMLIEHMLGMRSIEDLKESTVHKIRSGFPDGRDEYEIADLNAFYQQAKKRFDSEAEFADRARRRVVSLQSGDPETLAAWRRLVSASMTHFNEAYNRLEVTLTDANVRAESSYNPWLGEVLAELETKGMAVESDGATCVFPAGFTGTDGKPLPLIVRKTDGGYLYATTDLAAIRYRVRELGARRIIYVTDARQQQHFAMVFAAARLAGFADPQTALEHVPFGTILGPDNRPFKTREGGTVKLSDLLDEAEQRAAAIVVGKNLELGEADRKAVAHVVGMGAVKYADLSTDRVKDYVFSFERMLAMEGNTAPYLQYAYARIRSILRKAAEGGGAAGAEKGGETPFIIEQSAERALMLKLAQFAPTVRAVADSLEPHRLCNWLYELATAFSVFYESCPVLRAETGEVKRSRLGLCRLTASALERGLGLLGIGVLDRM